MARGIEPGQIRLALLVAPVVAVGAFLLVLSSAPPPANLDLGRLFFWIVLTLAASWLPVMLPGGIGALANTAPLIATAFDPNLANPFGLLWVAALGTFSLREFRREVPWYGVLYNHMTFALATYTAWIAASVSNAYVRTDDPMGTVAQIAVAGIAFAAVNVSLAVLAAAVRTGAPLPRVFARSIPSATFGFVSQVPLGWLMAEIAVEVGLWATLLFAAPLWLARHSFSRIAELRELFFGSVSALSQAIDAKDGYTRGHADRVSRIAGAIARELGLSESEIERIELAAMLHDIGKIGIEDRILLKPSRLDGAEQEAMRRHPIYSAAILNPSSQLRPLVPIVLHHHEHYDGSGYPDGLVGEEIPVGSRILLVADAYEAMTSDRLYRKAIGHDRALEQLHQYSGVQFDPTAVAAFERVLAKRGVGAFEASDLPPITYETVEELRRRLVHDRREGEAEHAHVG